MDSFLKMLTKAKSEINSPSSKSLHIVLGNESCDLDSTVSTLALSYLIHRKSQSSNGNIIVIPCLNVDEKYFHLRTEIIYLLNECGIDPSLLIFKSNFELESVLKNVISVSLVDHHVLAEDDKILEKYVSEIFDHRPENSAQICKNNNLRKNISLVGSCATLIANEILEYDEQILCKELNYLLYATIIYDTLGLQIDLGRTTEDDIKVSQSLEKLYSLDPNGKDLFSILWKVHNDTSTLAPKDLLYRDLKVTQGIPIAGLPMLARNYIKNDAIIDILENFTKEYNTKIVVLIGIDADQEVQRDVAVYFEDEAMKNLLVETLKDAKSPSLELSEVETDHSNIVCFSQGNVKLTRKFILPLVNEAANKFPK